jgi:hypothetical protein
VFDDSLVGPLGPTGMSRVLFVEGLNPGATTFTAKYSRNGPAGTVFFQNRHLIVEPR